MTVIVAMSAKNNAMRFFRGEVQGHISLEAMGENGFGYDFCFIPNVSTRTYAQMSIQEKLLISERHLALMELYKSLRGAQGCKADEVPRPC